MTLSACNPVNSPKTPETLSAQPPAQTEIYTPTPAEPTPTFTPTPTETATPTPEILTIDDFKVVDGKIQENKNGTWQEVSVPTEMGEISYVEEHEGKMYGIDTVDRAIVVRNEAGEWVKFERPIYGADFDNYKMAYRYVNGGMMYDFKNSLIDLSDLSSSQIKRYVEKDGTVRDWGYQKDFNYNYGTVFSGYLLGSIDAAFMFYDDTNTGIFLHPEKPQEYFIFEIPYKYSRQILLIEASHHDGSFQVDFGGVSTIYSFDNFFKYIENNMNSLKGKQILLELGVTENVNDDMTNFLKYSKLFKSYDIHEHLVINDNAWLGK